MSDNPLRDFQDFWATWDKFTAGLDRVPTPGLIFFAGYACGAAGVNASLKEVVAAFKATDLEAAGRGGLK